MASEVLTTVFDDLRLLVPHGMEAPQEGDGPCGGGGGPGPIVIPSHELDTETWADQELGGGGGGAGIPQGGIPGVKGPKPPKPRPKPEKGEKGEEGEEGEPTEGETGDKVADDLIDKYTKSHSASSDELREKMFRGEEEVEGAPGDVGTEMPWPDSIPRPTKEDVDAFWDKFTKDRRDYCNDPRTMDDSQRPDYDPTIRPPGIGLGGSLMQVGVKPKKTGLWKRAVRDWFKSLPIQLYEDKWTQIEPRLQSAFEQMRQITGYSARLPARDVPVPKKKAARVLVFVDVSGSVFSKGIQEEFASILRGVEEDVAKIEIFTFDAGDRPQEGPFTPKTYNPKFGGGGTEPWKELIPNILATPKYAPRNIDGYCMLTDGAFAHPPPGLIRRPKQWCFIMTSTYTSEALPSGSLIIPTFVDDPEYHKMMKEGKSVDIAKTAIVKQ